MTTATATLDPEVKKASPKLDDKISKSGVAIFTGGFDRSYAYGLAMALIAQGVPVDLIGSDDINTPEIPNTPGLRFLNLQGDRGHGGGKLKKIGMVALYYLRVLRYALSSRPKVFHILWNGKFEMFDRTLLMFYYKLLGRKLTLTAHNVNTAQRDSKDNWLNRLTLKTQYRTVDHIFLHTDKMKDLLLQDFAVPDANASIIPFGINNSVPDTDLTTKEARQKLGIKDGEKVLLFFGNIGPYKGTEFLVQAFQKIAAGDSSYRLIIAGKARGDSFEYLKQIQQTIANDPSHDRVIQKIEYIPDEDTEVYFKAADVFVLPYRAIYQSGVLILGYSFGLPVVAFDVGSLKDDILIGKTGFLAKPEDSQDLARALQEYFASDLFRELDARRQGIRDYAHEHHSWEIVGQRTRDVYADLLNQ